MAGSLHTEWVSEEHTGDSEQKSRRAGLIARACTKNKELGRRMATALRRTCPPPRTEDARREPWKTRLD